MGGGISTAHIGVTTTKALITANTLTGSAKGVVSLNTAIANWGDFSNSSNSDMTTLTNNGDLEITGNVKFNFGVTLNVTGTVSTTGTGKLTANGLLGSSTGAVTLSNASIGQLYSFAVQNSKSFSITNDRALIVLGSSATGGAVSITTTSGGIEFQGTNNVGALTLTSKTGITTSATAAINAASISATAQGGSINLTGLNVTNSVTGRVRRGR